MPILTRAGLDPTLRRLHDKKYKAQLREALGNLGLSPEQRGRIKAELDQVGKPRVYDASSPSMPGAIKLPD